MRKIIPLFLLSIIPLSVLASALPSYINAPGERTIVVSPRYHVWGAYSADGHLVRSGLASAGKNYCPDIKRPCRTKLGEYRIYHVEGSRCYSTRFPLPKGGAPMPYCMYFNGNQALHGSPNVVNGNISHGCVRMHTADARWLVYNFIDIPSYSNNYQGTRVLILPY